MLSDFPPHGKQVNVRVDETPSCCSTCWAGTAHTQSIPGAAAPTPAGKTWSWHSNGPWTQQKVAQGKRAGRAPHLEKQTNKKKVGNSLGKSQQFEEKSML